MSGGTSFTGGNKSVTLAKISGGLLVLFAMALGAMGDYLDANPVVGCLVIGLLIPIASLLAFSLGTLPKWREAQQDTALKIAVIIGSAGLAVSVLHIPLWVLLTREFPPQNFGSAAAAVATLAIGFSILGPLLPFLLVARRRLKR